MLVTPSRCHPIIYVRGYAMTDAEIDATVADPFHGFNLGSTVIRATPDKQRERKLIFESPVIRLASDFGYKDVFTDGKDIIDPSWEKSSIPKQSIIIYRYYEPASSLLGNDKTPDIEDFVKGLSELIARVRDLVCSDPGNETTPENFKCFLVGHSMGGLIIRGLLQNPKLDVKKVAHHVDKVFTYATPHNGIEFFGRNVPSWLASNKANTFSRERMAKYLNLANHPIYKKTGNVDLLPETDFPSERFFCLVGTNRADYETAWGLSSVFTGHGSDGLVRIENATIRGVDSQGKESHPAPKAFVYRSHSGYFDIVNSESSYQNLVRFLFGSVRVDIWLDIEEIHLPKALEDLKASGKTVNALYQAELWVSPKGKLFQLTRRRSEEDSAACFTHEEWKKSRPISKYLSTIYLADWARLDENDPSLYYSVVLGVRVPDYEVEKKLWLDRHYEGAYLFNDSLVIKLTPPQSANGSWEAEHYWLQDNAEPQKMSVDLRNLTNGKIDLAVPIDSLRHPGPGIKGKLRLVASLWN